MNYGLPALKLLLIKHIILKWTGAQDPLVVPCHFEGC